MKTWNLPEGLVEYRRTPLFTKESVPKALTARHNTKDGVWVELHVASGEITLTVCNEGSVALSAGQCAVLAPQIDHFVTLDEDASFFLKFFR